MTDAFLRLPRSFLHERRMPGSGGSGKGGVMAALQEPVQQLAGELVRGGRETGLQVAVYSGGQQVVDVVAGVADSATGRPVSADTPFYAFSVGKAMTAAIVHILAERDAFGEEGYDTAIAEFWPEFAQHGKQKMTIRHALTHTAGQAAGRRCRRSRPRGPGIFAASPGHEDPVICVWRRMRDWGPS